jgi:hypothetical protein
MKSKTVSLKSYSNATTYQHCALHWCGSIPHKLKDAEAARKRFAFEEVFLIQLERGRERDQQRAKKVLS